MAYLEPHRQFQIGLVAALGNHALTDLVATLRDRVRLHGLPGESTGDHIRKLAEVDCIAQRGGRGASAAMRRQLERSRGVWVEEARWS